MNHLKIACLVVLAILLSACAGSQRMYYWGDYSDTLYQSKKHPSDKSILSHQQALEKILEESGKNNLRVPPGVYAELGYIFFRQNKKDLAIYNYKMEKALYPESAVLMDRLENAAKLADKPKPSESDSSVDRPKTRDGDSPKALPDKPDGQGK